MSSVNSDFHTLSTCVYAHTHILLDDWNTEVFWNVDQETRKS